MEVGNDKEKLVYKSNTSKLTSLWYNLCVRIREGDKGKCSRL